MIINLVAHRATIEAQKVSDVSKIIMAKELSEKEAMQKMHTIEDQILLSREKAVADARYNILLCNQV